MRNDIIVKSLVGIGAVALIYDYHKVCSCLYNTWMELSYQFYGTKDIDELKTKGASDNYLRVIKFVKLHGIFSNDYTSKTQDRIIKVK